MSETSVNQMLTHMRAFQKMSGRWDEGEKGQAYARFEAAWGQATIPERQRYQSTLFREIRERATARQATTVVDLTARRRESRTGRSR